MARLISRARPLALTVLVAAATVVPNSAPRAADLSLADVPLFLATDVQPNLIMAIDDSTSMDSEVLLHTNDGAAWWRTGASGLCSTGANSFVGCGASSAGDVFANGELNFNSVGDATGTWKKFVYLFPNGHESDSTLVLTTDRRREDDGTNDHYAIPPLPQFAWARSPFYNSLYFNPAVQYEPWQKADGTLFPNADPTAAEFDPVFEPPAGSPSFTPQPAMNLTRDVAGTGSKSVGGSCSNSSPEVRNQYYFRVFKGMTIPKDTCIRRNYGTVTQNWEVVQTTGGCNIVDPSPTSTSCTTSEGALNLETDRSLAIRYFPATFYLKSPDNLPPDYGYTATPLDGEAPDGSVLKGFEIKPGNFIDDAHYKAARQNFANWFTYHRKRHLALRAGLGKAFKDIHKMRVAGFRINQADGGAAYDVAIADIDGSTGASSNRDLLYKNFYEKWVGVGGTPNRFAVGNIIRNFKRSNAGAPIQYACQKNFGMLFTDGFSNPTGPFGTADVDAGHGAPYEDGASVSVGGTMADGVMGAYETNLRPPPGFPAGLVPVPNACNGSNPDPRLDCRRDLHMNFYAITLDSRGVAFNPDIAQDPYTAPYPAWPTSFPARHPSAVDDLWHATVNGRGLMLNARGAGDIAAKLGEVLRNIIDRTSSASAAAVNSGIISSETRVYQARFNTTHWTGELLSFAIDPQNGQVKQDPDWDASEELPAYDARKIFTVDIVGGNNVAKTFRSDQLSDLRKEQVTGVVSPIPALVDNYVNYIRGQDLAGFRERPSKLGDIVSSAPLYVGAPRGRFSDKLKDADGGNGAETAYSIFAKTHKDRTPMIYAGANDGMLHAINARPKVDGGGKEQWAFIPGAVFAALPELAKPTYSHRYYVDGAPNVGDAFFGGAWHTVLVGGLNKGGKSIYALDVTDPVHTSEAGTPGMFLWEFTDADLGYTYSQPAVVRLHNGKWAAVFGNGYNNEGNRRAVLYVVDISNGSIIRKFDTGLDTADTNGMATPVLADVDGDRIVDQAYVGDLRGNLWKVDLSSKNDSEWDFAFKSTASKPLPLFTATAEDGTPQPITTRPEVARGPYGAGVVVLFGTGKYVETGDNHPVAGSPKQSFYGVIDKNTHTPGDRIESRNKLIAQTISTVLYDPDAGGTAPAFPVRTITGNTIDTDHTGWYMELPANGERQITNPVVRSDRVIFTTLIPTADACSFGGTSWLMEVDLLNGGTLPSAPLDTNGDGDVDEDDLMSDGKAVIGLMENQYLSAPAIIAPPDGDGPDLKIMSGSGGGLPTKAEAAAHGSRGRQSWRQIR